MRQIALLLGILIAFSSVIYAQVSARTTRTTFNKVANVDAVSIIIDGQDKNIDEVMENYLSNATGAKKKKVKGFIGFMGVRLREVSSRTLDVYYKVDKAGSKDNPAGEITLVLALGNETFLSPDRYPEEFDRATNLLNSMPLEVRIYELGLAIDDQEKSLDKAYKEYERTGKDSVSLEQTLIETQAAIEQNIMDRGDQRGTISEEASKLAEYRAMLEQEKRRALAPKEEEEMNAKGVNNDDEEDEENDEKN